MVVPGSKSGGSPFHGVTFLVGALILHSVSFAASTTPSSNPFFAEPIQNVTAIRGRNATISCHVRDLGKYKVAWVHVDRKMVLAIHDKVTTRIPRFGVSFDGDKTTWRLHIYNVQEDDKGKYMCQLNTDPMQAQLGLLDVVIPPSIDDTMSSPSTISVAENGEVTLQCHAKGFPTPTVEWRREDNQPIRLRNRGTVPKVDGSKLHLKSVTRKAMAAYLCIANNGIPPIVSKRITLDVEFQPTVSASETLVSSPVGHADVELRCVVEAYPKAMYYWTKNGSMVYDQFKYDQKNKVRYPYETEMVLRIKNVTLDDFDVYDCVAKNSLGEDSASIRLLRYGTTAKDAWHQSQQQQSSSSSRASKSEIRQHNNNNNNNKASSQPSSSSTAHQPALVTINNSARGAFRFGDSLLAVALALLVGVVFDGLLLPPAPTTTAASSSRPPPSNRRRGCRRSRRDTVDRRPLGTPRDSVVAAECRNKSSSSSCSKGVPLPTPFVEVDAETEAESRLD